MLPAPAQEVVDELLARLDRVVPGRIEGFYVVGSAGLGAFRVGRSDVDFLATVRGELSPVALRQLRAVHIGRWLGALLRAVADGCRWPLVCNGSYVRREDVTRSPLQVTPLAGHVAGHFKTASRDGLDLNPVTWHMLAKHAITIRGPGPAMLNVHVDAEELRHWTLENLNGYWRRWARQARSTHFGPKRAFPRRLAASGVLGAPRLHYTINTGAIASKEDAALYSLDVFEQRWHPLIHDALAYWRGEPPVGTYQHHPGRRRREAADFVEAVIDAANRTAAADQTTPRSRPGS